jgi:hypothetical protein
MAKITRMQSTFRVELGNTKHDCGDLKESGACAILRDQGDGPIPLMAEDHFTPVQILLFSTTGQIRIALKTNSHCHLEFPVDRSCLLACGKGEQRFSRDVIQQPILGFTAAFLLWKSSADPNGEHWWSESKPNFQTFTDFGSIEKRVIDAAESEAE